MRPALASSREALSLRLDPTASRVNTGAEPVTLTMRLLTLNLHKGFSALGRRDVLRDIRAAVRLVGADVVFLQEVVGARSHGGEAAPHARPPQYEFLADSLWSDHAYGRNAVSPRGHHGNAVLSRYPIEQFNNIDVSQRGDEARGLLHCRLRLPGRARPLHAVCVHLGLREAHRRRQLTQLCELVAQTADQGDPLLVAGDFNDWRLRGHQRLEEACTLADVHASAGGRPPRTFPARFPLLRLDRIYVRNVLSHRPLLLPARPWSHLSDHQPLAAEVQL